MNPKRDAERVGNIADGLVGRMRKSGAFEKERVAEAWKSISDEAMLRHTRVQAFLRGLVTVECRSGPLLSQRAQFRSRRLLEALRAALGEDVSVRDLRFVPAEC